MNGSIQDLTIVIRSVNERTEKLCKKLILEQNVPEENIFIIHETPFSKAMRVGYQIGIDQNLTLTYVIDADVLLREGAIKEMVEVIHQMPNNTLGISGKLLDKFIGMKRTAGNYLFHTKFLPHMINGIEPYEKESIRPESSIIKSLQGEGYIYKKNNLFIGLHDFEQHYHDIARKAFTHSKKHSEFISEFVTFWQSRSENDRDYDVALFGLAKGLRTNIDVKINIDNFKELYDEVKSSYGVKGIEFSDFNVQTGRDVYTEMHKHKNYFRYDDRLAEHNDRKFRTKFNEMSYKYLFKRLIVKFLKDLRLK